MTESSGLTEVAVMEHSRFHVQVGEMDASLACPWSFHAVATCDCHSEVGLPGWS